MRLLFWGSTKRGWMTLKALLQAEMDVVGIISLQQDPHETSRFEMPIAELARQYDVPLYETRWIKDRNFVSLIRDVLSPDVAIVVGCRVLIPREIYELPPQGTWAVHDSMLPAYRGFAPLNWSIINGAQYTGVTLFRLSEAVDGGDVLAQKQVDIGPHDDAPTVYEHVCTATIDVVLQGLHSLSSGTARPIAQDLASGTFCCARTPADGLLDWNESTAQLYNQVRALAFPYPGAFTYHRGRRLTIWRAAPVTDAPKYAGRIAGRVVGISPTGEVDVLTADGVLRIFDVQAEGEDRRPAAEVIRSVRDTLGIHPIQLLERIAALESEIARLRQPGSSPEVRG